MRENYKKGEKRLFYLDDKKFYCVKNTVCKGIIFSRSTEVEVFQISVQVNVRPILRISVLSL